MHYLGVRPPDRSEQYEYCHCEMERTMRGCE